MKNFSILLTKKSDYFMIALAISSLLLLACNIFYKTGFDSVTLLTQVWMVTLYFFATRGRVAANFIAHGIEPIIILFIFVALNIVILIANIVEVIV